MLVLSVRHGDTTTITTPTGDTISIMTLGSNAQHNDMRIGIQAPEEYRILRSNLRAQLLSGLKALQVFEVSSLHHGTVIVVADLPLTAIRCYKQRYPNSTPICIKVEDAEQQPWYLKLSAMWLHGHQPPFCIDIGV